MESLSCGMEKVINVVAISSRPIFPKVRRLLSLISNGLKGAYIDLKNSETGSSWLAFIKEFSSKDWAKPAKSFASITTAVLEGTRESKSAVSLLSSDWQAVRPRRRIDHKNISFLMK